jgi:DNA-binding PadR family transcriptional regulator
MTGYELKKFFSISFQFFSGLSYGSIYPALKKMEADGLITMRLEIQDGAPNRKVYTVTEDGKKAFIEALQQPISFNRQKNDFLTRLFFFAHLSREESLAAIQNYLDSIRLVQQELQQVQPRIEGRADKYQYLCLQFGLRYFQDLMGNISHIVQALEQDQTETDTDRPVTNPSHEPGPDTDGNVC